MVNNRLKAIIFINLSQISLAIYVSYAKYIVNELNFHLMDYFMVRVFTMGVVCAILGKIRGVDFSVRKEDRFPVILRMVLNAIGYLLYATAICLVPVHMVPLT